MNEQGLISHRDFTSRSPERYGSGASGLIHLAAKRVENSLSLEEGRETDGDSLMDAFPIQPMGSSFHRIDDDNNNGVLMETSWPNS